MDRTQRQGPVTRLPQHPRAVRSARPPFSFLSVLEVAAKHRPSPSGGSIINCSYSGSALERWSDDTDAHEGLGELSGMPLMWHVPGYFDVTLCHAEPRRLCEFARCQTKSRQTWLTFDSDSSEEKSGEMVPKWHFASQQIQIFLPIPTSLNFSFLPRGKNKKTKKEYLIAIFVRPQNLKYYGSITSMWKYFFLFLSPTLQLKVCGLSGIRTVGEFFYVIFFKWCQMSPGPNIALIRGQNTYIITW